MGKWEKKAESETILEIVDAGMRYRACLMSYEL